MKKNRKSNYHFSVSRSARSIWYNSFVNEWTGRLTFGLVSFLLTALWLFFRERYLAEYLFEPVISGLILAIMFGSWGYLEYLTIKNKSFPRSGYWITGNPAIVFGVFMMIIGCSFAAYSLYLAISGLIKII